MRAALLLPLLLLTLPAQAQWQILDSNTTADLRGIDNVGKGVVWASGSNGTVLRSEDAGYLWQTCAIPPNAEHLDFRGIQAFDANTAIVMSSGKGSLSRLYKTTDGCQTWTLLFTNPDPDGFWDALARISDESNPELLVLGDPANGHFTMLELDTRTAQLASLKPYGGGPTFASSKPYKGPSAERGEAAFAASNSSIFVDDVLFWIGTGGTSGARVIRTAGHGSDNVIWVTHPSSRVPLGNATDSSGVFSISFKSRSDEGTRDGVIVGGDYKLPDISTRTAAFTADGGRHWTAATAPPHGYRSAVAYDAATKTWITVGPNGTDISTDDGRNWRPLRPSKSDAPDADKNWNALSLPFVVGPHGRIGLLEPSALQSASH